MRGMDEFARITDLAEESIGRRIMGLRTLVLEMERPYADQNAMADVEGRPRPVVPIGINKSSNPLWRTSVAYQVSDAAH